jgi:hypothetical protein
VFFLAADAAGRATGLLAALVFVLVQRGLGSAAALAAAAATTTTACRGTASAATASSLRRKRLRHDANQRQRADGEGSVQNRVPHYLSSWFVPLCTYGDSSHTNNFRKQNPYDFFALSQR